jgi:hypothetical protein
MLKFMTAALTICILTSAIAEAKTKPKKTVKPLVVSSEQRAKIYAEVLARCRKQYGATLVEHVRLDLKHRRYICYIH